MAPPRNAEKKEKKEKKKKYGEKKAKVSDVFLGNELVYEEKVINSVIYGHHEVNTPP